MAVGEITVFPVGEGPDMQRHVQAAVAAIQRSGVRSQVTALGTNVEGDPVAILAAARAAFEACLASGARRAILEVRIDHRLDKAHTLAEMQQAGTEPAH